MFAFEKEALSRRYDALGLHVFATNGGAHRLYQAMGYSASSITMHKELGPSDAAAHYDVPPDWVCEILSPGTEAIDRGKKMRIYRRECIGHAWLINPITRTLEVYRLDPGHEPARWLLLDTFEDDAIVSAEPFEAFALALALLW